MPKGRRVLKLTDIKNPKDARRRSRFALRDLERLGAMRNPPYLKLSEIAERAANGKVSPDLLIETLKKRGFPIIVGE